MNILSCNQLQLKTFIINVTESKMKFRRKEFSSKDLCSVIVRAVVKALFEKIQFVKDEFRIKLLMPE